MLLKNKFECYLCFFIIWNQFLKWKAKNTIFPRFFKTKKNAREHFQQTYFSNNELLKNVQVILKNTLKFDSTKCLFYFLKILLQRKLLAWVKLWRQDV
jgi:hypothetical protein